MIAIENLPMKEAVNLASRFIGNYQLQGLDAIKGEPK